MKLKCVAAISAVVVLTTGLAGCVLQAPAVTAEPLTEIAGVEVLVSEPRSPDKFLREFEQSEGWTDADGVRHEYERAATTFPYQLPEGYAFPVEPILYGEEDLYEVGFGAAGAFEFWRGATATAAYAAHERGDTRLAMSLIDRFAEAYVKLGDAFMDWGNLGEPDLGVHVTPARDGNFAPLYSMEVGGFLLRDENRAIATAAGDVIK